MVFSLMREKEGNKNHQFFSFPFIDHQINTNLTSVPVRKLFTVVLVAKTSNTVCWWSVQLQNSTPLFYEFHMACYFTDGMLLHCNKWKAGSTVSKDWKVYLFVSFGN